ncbi:chemotaxis protein CheB [Alteraurantiacibacter palmitatis]|uniref:protein-glutamate methylesterase n=1 Tax=Alteraurantiacibacter palmitatis TaxID=2054628 RepID=A0ABV7E3W5_9SPHN
MRDARVLVVDDSAAMRALFSDILDQARGVTVVGTARDAADARQQIPDLKPNVLTLDVEMPGMSGIEFLAEIMEEQPMPVVMLSSLTQSGAETSLKAFELGAVECFPKPLRATPEQFNQIVADLGKIVLAAANSNVRDKPRLVTERAEAVPFDWNGRIVAIGASMGGIDALTSLFATYPANCPPTVVALQAEPALVQTFIAKLDRELPCDVVAASDGMALQQGTIAIAFDPARHVVVESSDAMRLRLVDRERVEGARPSATLLFGTLARAGMPAAGVVLSGTGSDGSRGLKLMRDAGMATLVQDPSTATVGEAPAAALAAGGAEEGLALEALAGALLLACANQ